MFLFLFKHNKTSEFLVWITSSTCLLSRKPGWLFSCTWISGTWDHNREGLSQHNAHVSFLACWMTLVLLSVLRPACTESLLFSGPRPSSACRPIRSWRCLAKWSGCCWRWRRERRWRDRPSSWLKRCFYLVIAKSKTWLSYICWRRVGKLEFPPKFFQTFVGGS